MQITLQLNMFKTSCLTVYHTIMLVATVFNNSPSEELKLKLKFTLNFVHLPFIEL